ncbi:MAG: hypothetical protein HFI39_11275 [Lachnospiraceae bacterium]|nr:hypothetical protein [Lachnospiraceae bacterium]
MIDGVFTMKDDRSPVVPEQPSQPNHPEQPNQPNHPQEDRPGEDGGNTGDSGCIRPCEWDSGGAQSGCRPC